MRLSIGLTLASIMLLSTAFAESKPEDYLKDGQLKDNLEILELQSGFAGFTGTYTSLATDGSWATGQYGPRERRGEAKASGKLTAEQIKTLATAFAKFDLATLPAHGTPETNPRVVKVTFGKKTVELQPKVKGTPEEDKAIRARYAGIVAAVKGACKPAKE